MAQPANELSLTCNRLARILDVDNRTVPAATSGPRDSHRSQAHHEQRQLTHQDCIWRQILTTRRLMNGEDQFSKSNGRKRWQEKMLLRLPTVAVASTPASTRTPSIRAALLNTLVVELTLRRFAHDCNNSPPRTLIANPIRQDLS